jgi:hypothetical protein
MAITRGCSSSSGSTGGGTAAATGAVWRLTDGEPVNVSVLCWREEQPRSGSAETGGTGETNNSPRMRLRRAEAHQKSEESR